jgi:hypothetical protein
LRLAWAFFALATPSLVACPGSSEGTCGDERDVSGSWRFVLTPAPLDGGAPVTTLDQPIDIDATLEQAGSTDFLNLGHYVYGTLTASDPGAFTTLTIPRLTMNDGSKSGAVLGCALRINVPIASPVSDDNVDQGPMRISLAGQIDSPGHVLGMDGSQLIRSDEPTKKQRSFAWTGSRR